MPVNSQLMPSGSTQQDLILYQLVTNTAILALQAEVRELRKELLEYKRAQKDAE